MQAQSLTQTIPLSRVLRKADITEKGIERPLILHKPSAGAFPSPALDYMVSPLNITEKLIKNADATYFMIIQGDSLKEIGIYDGDTIVVDRSVHPGNGKLVVASLYGELYAKRMEYKGNQLWLYPENKQYRPIEVTVEMDCRIWGVVTAFFRTFA